jgi:hypothetical protein
MRATDQVEVFMKFENRVAIATILSVVLFGNPLAAKNPPKTKGKTPPNTFVASDPEYVPAEKTPGLTAPPNYERMPVSTPRQSVTTGID